MSNKTCWFAQVAAIIVLYTPKTQHRFNYIWHIGMDGVAVRIRPMSANPLTFSENNALPIWDCLSSPWVRIHWATIREHTDRDPRVEINNRPRPAYLWHGYQNNDYRLEANGWQVIVEEESVQRKPMFLFIPRIPEVKLQKWPIRDWLAFDPVTRILLNCCQQGQKTLTVDVATVFFQWWNDEINM